MIERLGNIYGEDKGTGYAGNVWDTDYCCPTINCCLGGGRQPMIVEQLGYMDNGTGQHQSNTVYDPEGLSPKHNNRVVEVVAMRGRNPENPSDRTKGAPTEQRLEPQSEGICNALTSVQKDNLIMEPKLSQYRIRKLTPKECWRLMGFNDEEFSRAEKVNSNTQLYKQAGNSIVVDVLVAIFRNLMEVLDMKKVEETKTIKYETDKMIDLAALMENEPDLFDELCADYPCEDAVYIYDVKGGNVDDKQ